MNFSNAQLKTMLKFGLGTKVPKLFAIFFKILHFLVPIKKIVL
jgi:hypothetical protein